MDSCVNIYIREAIIANDFPFSARNRQNVITKAFKTPTHTHQVYVNSLEQF